MFFDMYWTEVHRKKSSICDQHKYMGIIQWWPSWNLTPAEAIFGGQIVAICGEGQD